jgi:hypothetical protein
MVLNFVNRKTIAMKGGGCDERSKHKEKAVSDFLKVDFTKQQRFIARKQEQLLQHSE